MPRARSMNGPDKDNEGSTVEAALSAQTEANETQSGGIPRQHVRGSRNAPCAAAYHARWVLNTATSRAAFTPAKRTAMSPTLTQNPAGEHPATEPATVPPLSSAPLCANPRSRGDAHATVSYIFGSTVP